MDQSNVPLIESSRPLPWIIRNKRNALAYSVVTFGGGVAAGLLWAIPMLRSPGVAIFVIAVSLGSGYVWGLLMWKLFLEPRLRRLQQGARDGA